MLKQKLPVSPEDMLAKAEVHTYPYPYPYP